jgi:dolichol kinase
MIKTVIVSLFLGLHPALKLSWVFFHGLASVKLIQHFMRTFPSCASIGMSLLYTGYFYLCFGFCYRNN